MADEDTKEPEVKEEAKAGKVPWLPLSLMLLIVPVLTLVITEFVVIPRLKVSLGADSGVAAGGTHTPVAVDAGGGGHGGGHGGDTSPTAGGSGFSYSFDDMVSNISGTLGTRFIKVSFELRGDSEGFSAQVRNNKPMVQDAIIASLSSVTIQSLEAAGGRNRLRVALIEAINGTLEGVAVEELYFTAFIIQ